MNKWIDCNLKRSAEIAQNEGDPASLALSANQLCEREERAFQRVLAAIYRPTLVLDMMQELKAKQIRANTSKIIKARVESRFFNAFPSTEPAQTPAPAPDKSKEPKLVGGLPGASTAPTDGAPGSGDPKDVSKQGEQSPPVPAVNGKPAGVAG